MKLLNRIWDRDKQLFRPGARFSISGTVTQFLGIFICITSFSTSADSYEYDYELVEKSVRFMTTESSRLYRTDRFPIWKVPVCYQVIDPPYEEIHDVYRQEFTRIKKLTGHLIQEFGLGCEQANVFFFFSHSVKEIWFSPSGPNSFFVKPPSDAFLEIVSEKKEEGLSNFQSQREVYEDGSLARYSAVLRVDDRYKSQMIPNLKTLAIILARRSVYKAMFDADSEPAFGVKSILGASPVMMAKKFDNVPLIVNPTAFDQILLSILYDKKNPLAQSLTESRQILLKRLAHGLRLQGLME